jgi:hypothetical protein
MTNESTRAGAGPSWPLRVGLGLCVTALVIVGFQLKDAHRSPAATPTTTLRSTPTTTTFDADDHCPGPDHDERLVVDDTQHPTAATAL